MKNYLIWILITLCSSKVSASEEIKNKLIICFAQEEEVIHKNKIKGPIYSLNQLFINDISSYNDFSLKEKYFKEICETRPLRPSFKMMKFLLIEGISIFNLSGYKETESQKALRLSTLNELKSNMPNIFFKYVSHLQSKSPRAHCLTDYIPHLSKIMERYHFLEEDLQETIFTEEKKKVYRILNSLENISDIYKSCAKDLRR